MGPQVGERKHISDLLSYRDRLFEVRACEIELSLPHFRDCDICLGKTNKKHVVGLSCDQKCFLKELSLIVGLGDPTTDER